MRTDRIMVRLCCMIVVCVLASGSALANGFRNPPESARGLGMDGGKTSLIDDPSAISINPANLMEVENISVMGSFTFVYAETEFEGVDGREGKTRDSLKFLPNIHAAWPVENDLVFGLGVTTPFGQSTEWRKDGPFRYEAPHFAQMTTVNIAPTLATKVGDALSIGVSANVYWSELELRQMVPWAMATGVPGLPDGEARLKGDGFGFGGSAGITWQATDSQRFALVYKSPFNVEYDGNARLGNAPPPLAMAGADRSDFDSEIKFPTIVALGYGLEVRDDFRIGLEVEWIEFSRFEELPIEVGQDNIGGMFPQSVDQDWKDTWTLGVGGEWEFAFPWTLRAGYSFMESPIPSRTMAPTLPDADRHLLSIGLGYEHGLNAWDVAYAYSIFDDRKIRDNQNPAFDGDYELSSHLFQISWNRAF